MTAYAVRRELRAAGPDRSGLRASSSTGSGAAAGRFAADAARAGPDERRRRRHRRQRAADPRRDRPRPRRPARSSSSSPSSRSPAIRPRTCCSRSTSSRDARAAVDRIAADAAGIVAVVGFPERADDVYNAAAVLADGEVQGDLPQDAPAQLRRLRRGPLLPGRAEAGGHRGRRRHGRADDLRGHLGARARPATDEALAGATLIVNSQRLALPRAARRAERERCSPSAPRDNLSAVAFCALVGGQDELVFDGASFVLDHRGPRRSRARRSSPRTC